MAYVAPVPRGGKPPTKVTWTYDDGSKLGPDTDQAVARLFHRMTENLTVDELRLLDMIVKRRTAELTEVARLQTLQGLATRVEQNSRGDAACVARAREQNRLEALAADMPQVGPAGPP